ncbi:MULTISPECIES: CPBP family intramembrane glutamic endopeptidase [Streptococcus]|uniref:CPBP family intramembrane glutamic endopeptidase n=1 Tax=Streptococcus caledonicus TaxID=2614158 RepID=A0ABW0UHR5_9STRE|nr:type II CAAX endopeptidase family protein [Streptococcus sp. S784/96/1]
MKKHVLRGLVYGLLAIMTYGTSQLVQLPALLFLKDNGNAPLTGLQLTMSLVIYFLAIVGVFFLALKLNLIKPKENLNWKKLALFLFGGEVAIYAVSMIGVIISLAMGDEILATNQAAIEELITQLPAILMFTMIVLGAPIMEETICRGLIPRMFSTNWRWLGYIVGAILFGLAHVPNTVGTAVQYIGMGLVLSAVAYFSKRLEYSMLLHFLHNSIGFLILLLQIK